MSYMRIFEVQLCGIKHTAYQIMNTSWSWSEVPSAAEGSEQHQGASG